MNNKEIYVQIETIVKEYLNQIEISSEYMNFIFSETSRLLVEKQKDLKKQIDEGSSVKKLAVGLLGAICFSALAGKKNKQSIFSSKDLKKLFKLVCVEMENTGMQSHDQAASVFKKYCELVDG